jgi:hypothetical protein
LHGWLSSFEASIAAKLWPGSRRTTMLDWLGAQTEHSQPGGEGLERVVQRPSDRQLLGH